jgi:asparagine synthase (glutamine-hydrolysing)
MCGITGVAGHGGGSALPLDAMRATLRHRGPDDTGLFWSDDRSVGLGHCRLSIIDLSAAGHQPMSDAAGDLTLAFNGEIYNYRELREDLRRRGHAFRTASDTEVVIAAHREWGDDVLAQLDGMFAIALYDRGARSLLLARDRAGEKPLFWSHRNGTLRWASELKALMADPSFARRIDPSALDAYLTYGYVPGDSCIFDGVHKLRQGEALRYDIERDEVRRWTYWQLPEPEPSSATPEELERELETLLEGAVRRQLVADVCSAAASTPAWSPRWPRALRAASAPSRFRFPATACSTKGRRRAASPTTSARSTSSSRRNRPASICFRRSPGSSTSRSRMPR